MKRLSGFICGVLVTVLVFGLTTIAFAALEAKTIDVHTGVDIYVNDVKFTPTDVNGNEVEVLLYNGTTYLPVRAIGQAYATSVYWDDATKSVYVGEHAGTPIEDGVYNVFLNGASIEGTSDYERMTVDFAEPVGLTQAEVDALVPGKSVVDFSDEVSILDPVKVETIVYNDDKTEFYINDEYTYFCWSDKENMWVLIDPAGAGIYAKTGETALLYGSDSLIVEDWSNAEKATYYSLTTLKDTSHGLNNLTEITVVDGKIAKVVVFYHP